MIILILLQTHGPITSHTHTHNTPTQSLRRLWETELFLSVHQGTTALCAACCKTSPTGCEGILLQILFSF